EAEAEGVEAWEEADGLLSELRGLSSSLLSAQHSVDSRQASADHRKIALQSKLEREVLAIVQEVSATPNSSCETVEHKPPIHPPSPPQDATEPSLRLSRGPFCGASGERRTGQTVGEQGSERQGAGGTAKPPRANPLAEAPAASILSEVSRLASKPLLPTQELPAGAVRRKARPATLQS
ncbi:MAG: hypothetical protein SGPRY_006877, partial [Prymnesium sp.]